MKDETAELHNKIELLEESKRLSSLFVPFSYKQNCDF